MPSVNAIFQRPTARPWLACAPLSRIQQILEAVNDALVLARQVDGVLWVAAYGITHPGALAWSKQQADRIEARSVGVVLNRVPRRRHWFRSMGGRSAVETNRYWTSLQ